MIDQFKTNSSIATSIRNDYLVLLAFMIAFSYHYDEDKKIKSSINYMFYGSAEVFNTPIEHSGFCVKFS